MKFLFCCEFYYPSVGGVQEVMRQIAERLVDFGHEVTVATSRLANRDFVRHNGVHIKEFVISGNTVRGMSGELQSYQDFVLNHPCDALLIKAAQQWTFDALFDVFDKITVRKVFIPCGFSGLYEPSYKHYFTMLPSILRQFDHLIFYSEQYRDIDFAKKHGLKNYSILSNGASEKEFEVPVDPAFRERYQIPKEAFLLMTVGTLTGAKGHNELAEAVSLLKIDKKPVYVILNGNSPPKPAMNSHSLSKNQGQLQANDSSDLEQLLSNRFVNIAICVYKMSIRILGLVYRSFGVFYREGSAGILNRVKSLRPRKKLQNLVDEINNRNNGWKKALIIDLPRNQLVQAYMAADLFVFASNIEYSPLVLFETIAAGTPFLSVPVGNASEIARWTGGGLLCPASQDKNGYTHVEPAVLAHEIEGCVEKEPELKKMGLHAKEIWRERYTWAAIAKQYESILLGVEGLQNNKNDTPSESLVVE